LEKKERKRERERNIDIDANPHIYMYTSHPVSRYSVSASCAGA
jgi:hypothetical protein